MSHLVDLLLNSGVRISLKVDTDQLEGILEGVASGKNGTLDLNDIVRGVGTTYAVPWRHISLIHHMELPEGTELITDTVLTYPDGISPGLVEDLIVKLKASGTETQD